MQFERLKAMRSFSSQLQLVIELHMRIPTPRCSKYQQAAVNQFDLQQVKTALAGPFFDLTEKRSMPSLKLKRMTRLITSNAWQSSHGPTLGNRQSLLKSLTALLVVLHSHLTAKLST